GSLLAKAFRQRLVYLEVQVRIIKLDRPPVRNWLWEKRFEPAFDRAADYPRPRLARYPGGLLQAFLEVLRQVYRGLYHTYRVPYGAICCDRPPGSHSSQRGRYQLRSPSRARAAGTRMPRTTVASI